MIILRCPICDWPLAESREQGCVLGDYSYRPAEGSAEYARIQMRRREFEIRRRVPFIDGQAVPPT